MKYVLYSSDYVTKILEKKGFNFEYRITVDSNEINNDVKSVYYLKNNYNGEKIIIPSFISDDINSDDIYNYMISIGFDRNNILFIPIEMIYGDEAIDVDKFYKYDDVTYLDYIEININDHCNLNCKGCSHFAPLAPASFKNFNTFLKDIKRLKQLIPHIFKIRIMGGEPFLNPELKRYVETLKEVYPYSDLRIVTNGLLLKNRTGHNMSVIGTTGSGKSFLLKLLITNEFARGTKLFLFDIENELEKLTNRCGGEYIDLSSKSLINPLQIRYVSTDDDTETSILGKHLGFLENFFITAFEDISEKELVVLLDIVEKFYNSRGITKKTTLEEFENMTAKDYPIFSDLYAFLLEQQKNTKTKELERILVNIEVLLKRMVTGQDGNLYNGITTIDLSNNLVVFNLQELLFNSSRRLINTQMINLLTYLSNEIVDNKKKNDKKNKKQNMLIVVDEFHYFIDEDNPTLLKYFGQMARRLRKYNAGIVVATQQPSDLTSSAGVLRHASSLFGNCQYQITGMLKDNDVQAIEKIYANTPLTETQKSFLSKCGQGQFLINITNKNRLRINVFATPLQLYYMGETDESPNED